MKPRLPVSSQYGTLKGSEFRLGLAAVWHERPDHLDYVFTSSGLTFAKLNVSWG